MFGYFIWACTTDPWCIPSYPRYAAYSWGYSIYLARLDFGWLLYWIHGIEREHNHCQTGAIVFYCLSLDLVKFSHWERVRAFIIRRWSSRVHLIVMNLTISKLWLRPWITKKGLILDNDRTDLLFKAVKRTAREAREGGKFTFAGLSFPG